MNRKVKSSSLVRSMFVFLIATIIINSGISYASSISFDEVGVFGNKYEILKNTNDHYPADKWPFNDSSLNLRSVGIDTLYGDMKELTRYLGEVPKDKSEDKRTKKYRTAGSYKIDKDIRPWLDSTSSGYHNLDYDDITPEYAYSSKEWHLLSLPKARGASIDYIIYLFMYLVYMIASFPLNIISEIKSLDLWFIMDSLDSGGAMSKLFNSMFLYDSDTRLLSPFMVILLSMFIISLVGTVLKIAKGNESAKLIMKEFSFLVISLFLAGLSVINGNSTGGNKIAILSTDLADKLSNTIALSSTEEGIMYLYNTGDTKRDAQETQRAFLKKPAIDLIIEMQFGEKLGELDLGKGKFGRNEDEAIRRTFNRTPSSSNNFQVTNGSYLGSDNTINNLGYYWWAANSLVDEKKPFPRGVINSATSDRILYIFDFLNNLRKIEVRTDNNPVVLNKIDNIMTSFNKPRYWSGILPMFMLSLLSLAEAYALFLIVLFLSIGKLIVTVGVFAMPILPGLYLSEKTRPLAKNLFKTYLSGFARLLIGLIMFNIVLSMLSIIVKEGTGGILLGIVLCIAIGKLVPKLIIEITKIISRQDMGFMNPLNSAVINTSSKISENRSSRKRERRERGRLEFGEDGLERKEDRLDREREEDKNKQVKEGLDRHINMNINQEDYKIKSDTPVSVEESLIEQLKILKPEAVTSESYMEEGKSEIEESEDIMEELIELDKEYIERLSGYEEPKKSIDSFVAEVENDIPNEQEIIESENEEEDPVPAIKIDENGIKKLEKPKNYKMANILLNMADKTTLGHTLINKKYNKDKSIREENIKIQREIEQKIKEKEREDLERSKQEAENEYREELKSLLQEIIKSSNSTVPKEDIEEKIVGNNGDEAITIDEEIEETSVEDEGGLSSSDDSESISREKPEEIDPDEDSETTEEDEKDIIKNNLTEKETKEDLEGENIRSLNDGVISDDDVKRYDEHTGI